TLNWIASTGLYNALSPSRDFPVWSEWSPESLVPVLQSIDAFVKTIVPSHFKDQSSNTVVAPQGQNRMGQVSTVNDSVVELMPATLPTAEEQRRSLSPRAGTDSGEPIMPHSRLLPATDLARAIGLPKENIGPFLSRHAEKHSDCREEMECPRPTEPRYLY